LARIGADEKTVGSERVSDKGRATGINRMDRIDRMKKRQKEE
jgi:hypothetical protein